MLMTDWKQELADAEEAAGQLNALQRLDPLPDESTDLYAQAFGSFVLNPLQTDMATAEAEQVKQLLKKIDELNRQVADQNTVVDTLTNETDQLQVRVSHPSSSLQSYLSTSSKLKNIQTNLLDTFIRVVLVMIVFF